MPKFVTNRINLNPGSFDDFVKKVLDGKKANEATVKTASTKSAVKVAAKEEEQGPDSGQPKAEAKLVNHPEKPKAGKAGKVDDTTGPDSGQPAAEAKLTNHPEVQKEPYGKKAAESKPKFQKIAKLDGKTRAWLADYWKNLYPAEYVEAMLAEK